MKSSEQNKEFEEFDRKMERHRNEVLEKLKQREIDANQAQAAKG